MPGQQALAAILAHFAPAGVGCSVLPRGPVRAWTVLPPPTGHHILIFTSQSSFIMNGTFELFSLTRKSLQQSSPPQLVYISMEHPSCRSRRPASVFLTLLCRRYYCAGQAEFGAAPSMFSNNKQCKQNSKEVLPCHTKLTMKN